MCCVTVISQVRRPSGFESGWQHRVASTNEACVIIGVEFEITLSNLLHPRQTKRRRGTRQKRDGKADLSLLTFTCKSGGKATARTCYRCSESGVSEGYYFRHELPFESRGCLNTVGVEFGDFATEHRPCTARVPVGIHLMHAQTIIDYSSGDLQRSFPSYPSFFHHPARSLPFVR